MKLHYFEQDKADTDDVNLQMAVAQGYVPTTCLLNGQVVMDEIQNQRNPCWGCSAPREKCNGKLKEP